MLRACRNFPRFFVYVGDALLVILNRHVFPLKAQANTCVVNTEHINTFHTFILSN